MTRRIRQALIAVFVGLLFAAQMPTRPAVAQALPVPVTILSAHYQYQGDLMGEVYDVWLKEVLSPLQQPPAAAPQTGRAHVAFALSTANAMAGTAKVATMIDANQAQIGVIDQATARRAMNGELPGSLPPTRQLRALFPAYRSAILFFMQNTPTGGLAALSGKKIDFERMDSSVGLLLQDILKGLGIAYTPYYSGQTAANSLRTFISQPSRYGQANPQSAAVAFAGGLPWTAEMRYDVTRAKMNVLVFDAKEKTRTQTKFPFLDFAAIPPGGLGLDKKSGNPLGLNKATIRTLGIWNFAVTNTSLPVCTAYWLVDAVMAAAPRYRDVPRRPDDNPLPPEATRPEDFRQIQFVPLHAGAALWMKDHNIPLPRDQKADPTEETCR